MRHTAILVQLLALLAFVAPVRGQDPSVPNPSFEEGGEGPAGWALSGGKGAWSREDPGHGVRAVSVTGDGNDDNEWVSAPIPFKPSTAYRLAFMAKNLDGIGGTPVSGPEFCNRDLGGIARRWKRYESVFFTPADRKASVARIRFGQWQVRGTVAFDDVRLCEVHPVYESRDGVTLGQGERLLGTEYFFRAPFHSLSRNHARPLEYHRCRFNTNRWVFEPGAEVVYRHRIGNRKQTGGKVTVGLRWHQEGSAVVSASCGGKEWRILGTLARVEAKTFALPGEMDGAREIRIRLSVGEKEDASFQVGEYEYTARVDGLPLRLVGRTRFWSVLHSAPEGAVTVVSLGEGVPGGWNAVRIRARNDTAGVLRVTGRVTVSKADRVVAESLRTLELQPGKHTLEFPYELPETGLLKLKLALEGGLRFTASTSLVVAELYRSDYGESLPGSTDFVKLWWASSGWKISRTRPAPDSRGAALLIRAARNESEAAQLVVRPEKGLKGFHVSVKPLKGPEGAVIPPEAVDVLCVRYVEVTRTTDSTGVIAPWPDPLPPLRKPVDIKAGRNQPLWVRVRVPKTAAPGRYSGSLLLEADGWKAEVPVRVEVFDFTLPDRMTCSTAFGFSPGNVWRYQKVKDPEQRRRVLEKYWENFSAHHVSPYDPAPLDSLRVTWPTSAWEGGTRDRECKRSGDLKPDFSWERWDEAMTRAVDRFHFNSFRLSIPGLGGGTFHSRREPSLLGFGEETPEYKEAFSNFCGALEDHLKEKGWLDEAFVYWFDEPSPKDYAFVMNGFRKLEKAAPGIRRMLTEQVEEKLVGGPNIWCPVSYHYDHEEAEARRKLGDRFWWYVCTGPKAPYCTLFIDHPATELRVWLWQTWKRGIEGVLVWQTNYWTSPAAYPDRARPQNPYEDPMGWVSGYSTPAGTKRAWGNGDGRFIYPPEEAASGRQAGPVLEGPVDSIRWEMLRDGIEDYEYLAVLHRLLQEKREGLTAEEAWKAEELLKVPASISESLISFTVDPRPIEERRLALARVIEALGSQ